MAGVNFTVHTSADQKLQKSRKAIVTNKVGYPYFATWIVSETTEKPKGDCDIDDIFSFVIEN